MTQDTIRLAGLEDAEALPAIERSAGEAFRRIPELAWIADGDDLPVERHRQWIEQGTCWIALDEQNHPIGFLSAEVFSRELHIWELSVRQEQQGRGLGRRLIQRAIEEAKVRGLAAVTLTTFRDITWNEPFYARLGFRTLDNEEAGSRLTAALRREVDHGMPRERRCAMRLAIRLGATAHPIARRSGRTDNRRVTKPAGRAASRRGRPAHRRAESARRAHDLRPGPRRKEVLPVEPIVRGSTAAPRN